MIFLFLSLINLPLCYLYSSVTVHNNYFKFNDHGFSFFSIGNLAEENPTCSSASIDFESEPKEIELVC